MPRMKGNGAKVTSDPTKPMGIHGMHSWWYRRLADAGIVPEGTTSGGGCTRRGTQPASECSTPRAT